jgi:hypothetical protein
LGTEKGIEARRDKQFESERVWQRQVEKDIK